MGMKETKDVLKLGIGLGEAVEQGLANNGKLGIEDAPLFFSALMDAKDAFENIKDVPAELANMTAEQSADLHSFFKTELDLEDDKVEEAIERTVGTVLKVYELVSFFRAMKAAKAAPAVDAADGSVEG